MNDCRTKSQTIKHGKRYRFCQYRSWGQRSASCFVAHVCVRVFVQIILNTVARSRRFNIEASFIFIHCSPQLKLCLVNLTDIYRPCILIGSAVAKERRSFRGRNEKRKTKTSSRGQTWEWFNQYRNVLRNEACQRLNETKTFIQSMRREGLSVAGGGRGVGGGVLE